MAGAGGRELFTFKVKTSVRAPNVTNVGWDVTLGHADQPMPRSNPACQTARVACGVQIPLPKKDAIEADRHAQTVPSYGARCASPLVRNRAENWLYDGIHPIFVGCRELGSKDERRINPVSLCVEMGQFWGLSAPGDSSIRGKKILVTQNLCIHILIYCQIFSVKQDKWCVRYESSCPLSSKHDHYVIDSTDTEPAATARESKVRSAPMCSMHVNHFHPSSHQGQETTSVTKGSLRLAGIL